ncbi:extracellular solute-binding protein [Nocardia mexicana]|uniref:Carbohydrate ABC transporter substrate-binding protein (CUT1 family) n=1 Tax=Nocardia mexicana TaxID=279262 RepID=A0A370H8N5_9NOCA|nr:extracellular solute-binding protein [Nocardia mexicana]RDI52109.1 carbohydrate ABC transporter substrate-binding protein (CUT1 family) [Nocardia mexicana]
MKRPLRGAFSSIALFTGLALAVSSCGFGGNSSDDSDPNTLSFLAASYSDGTKASWDRITADFHAQNPDIKVNVQVESWDSINDVVRTKLQSKSTTPDLLNIDAYSTFATDGQLYPASEVVSPAVLADIQPGFAKNASIGGTQWALPLFASTRTLFYNTELLARAGVATPPKTWAELTDAAKKIQALGGGVSGYGLPLGSEEAQGETSIWTFGAGGNWSDGDKITVDTAANTEGVQAMKSVAESGVTQPNPGATDRKDVINSFIQGKIGMIEGLPPVIGMIDQKNPGLKYATAPSPTKSGDPVTLGVADHLMAFKKDGKKTEAIKKFLDYFYSAPVYSKFVQSEHFIPITTGGTQAMAEDPVVKAFSATLPVAKFYPSNNPKWGAAQGAIRQQMGTVAQGADPASVLQRIQQAAS